MRPLHAFRRGLRTLLTLLLLTPQVTGCTVTSNVALADGVRLEEIVGLTSTSGRKIEFAAPGATVASDTLRAVVSSGPLAIPTDSIRTLAVRHVDSGETIGLVVILAGLVGLAISAATVKFNVGVGTHLRVHR